MTRTMTKSTIHRARATDADLDHAPYPAQELGACAPRVVHADAGNRVEALVA